MPVDSPEMPNPGPEMPVDSSEMPVDNLRCGGPDVANRIFGGGTREMVR